MINKLLTEHHRGKTGGYIAAILPLNGSAPCYVNATSTLEWNRTRFGFRPLTIRASFAPP